MTDDIRPLEGHTKTIQELIADIGKRVRYILPRGQEARARFIRKHGSLCLEEFQIKDVKRNWLGANVYEIKCVKYGSTLFVEPGLVMIQEGVV